jgi:hypothetical protein
MTRCDRAGRLKRLLSGVGRAAKPLDRPFLLAYDSGKSELDSPVTEACTLKHRWSDDTISRWKIT